MRDPAPSLQRRLFSRVRQFNGKNRQIRNATPAFIGVSAPIFENVCGGTFYHVDSFIDMPINLDRVAACM